MAISSYQSYTNKSLNTSALESLLKITDVLKETLSVTENNIENTTPIATYTTYNTYVAINKKTIEVIKNNTYNIKPKIYPKYNDLIKGKIKFENDNNSVVKYTYNLKNIIPNPLYNDYINNNFDNDIYATGDIDGLTNTTYLKLNKNNIVNNISKEYYLPSIGELGISMENIQTINNSIDALGEEYADCKIPYNAILASSSLYSNENILNTEYKANTINNVWCFENKEAKITYHSINEKYTLLPFYKYNNNIAINLEEEFDDVVINSIETISNYLGYYELDPQVHNFEYNVNYNKLSDFNIFNWLEHPFNSKYFFNILFPEVSSYISKNNNFTYMHDRYLAYYAYLHDYVNNNTKDGYVSSVTKNGIEYIDIENYTYTNKKNYEYNDGLTFPSYVSYIIKNDDTVSYYLSRNDNEFWTQHLIYNTPIYNNLIVLTPTYGSGESKYNCDKNKAKSTLYIAIPMSCTNFDCKMNNITDCTINIVRYLQVKGFNIYRISFSFNVDVPTDNVIIFSCEYNGETIEKKFFYTIHSLLLNNSINVSYFTYFYLDNYYVARDPYYWWKADKWNTFNRTWQFDKNNDVTITTYITYKYSGEPTNFSTSIYSYLYHEPSFGKLFNASYYSITDPVADISNKTKYNIDTTTFGNNCVYITLPNQINNHKEYVNAKQVSLFKELSSVKFNGIYDMSYLIDYIGKNMNIKEYGTVSDRGLFVDKMLDKHIIKKSYTFSSTNLFENFGNNSILSYQLNNNYKYYYKYLIFNYQPMTNLFQNGMYYNMYHTLPLYTYFNMTNYDYDQYVGNITNNEDICFDVKVKYTSQNNNSFYTSFYTVTDTSEFPLTGYLYNYRPILRINRTVDNFGLYNDLIFGSNYYNKTVINKYHISNLVTNSNVQEVITRKQTNTSKTNIVFKVETNYDIDSNNDNDYNRPRLSTTIPDSFYNTINCNLPIVGAKETLCFPDEIIKYCAAGMFQHMTSTSFVDNTIFYNAEILRHLNYIFSDYLFLFNNTNSIITLMISDPSLSLSNKKNVLIQLKSKEFKLYYPNNFIYNNINKTKQTNILYSIKLINNTTNIDTIYFKHYALGKYNLTLEEIYNVISNNINSTSLKVNKMVFDIYYDHGNPSPRDIGNVNIYDYRIINDIIPQQLGYRLVTNLMYQLSLQYNGTKKTNYKLNEILELYNEIYNYRKQIMDSNYINPSHSIHGDSETLLPINQEIKDKKLRKKISEFNIYSFSTNKIDIDIENYLENHAGHLIVIESDKVFEEQEFESSQISDVYDIDNDTTNDQYNDNIEDETSNHG